MGVPVVIGVGDLLDNREQRADAGLEPSELMLAATRLACADAGLPYETLREIDTLLSVDQRTWAYDDLLGLLSAALGCRPSEATISPVGGNQPVMLVDRAAARIAVGQARLALVTGGEAIASATAAFAAMTSPDWSQDPGGMAHLDTSEFQTELSARYGLSYPTRVYPLWENALRARLKLSYEENQAWSGELYAAMTRVAAGNPAAWNPLPLDAAEIMDVRPDNRIICWPYPLLVNALLKVNQGAAVLVADRDWALARGVPAGRMVTVRGGAAAYDDKDVLFRPSYDSSPSMTDVLTTALEIADTPVEELALDLYSCFPCVPKMACEVLGVPRGTVTSAAGGLTAFGGPLNDYCLHAVAAMTRQLRARPGVGLVYGNGEYVTKHSAVVLSSLGGVYAGRKGTALPRPEVPTVVDHRRGPALVETFTVEFDRSGEPRDGTVITRNPDGTRSPAWVSHAGTLAWLTDPEVQPVGMGGQLVGLPDGRTGFERR